MDLGGDAPACPAAVDARTPPLVASPLNDITKMANLKPVRTAVPPGSALHRTLSIESKSAGSSPHDGPFPFAPSPVATKAATVKTKFTPTATKMAAANERRRALAGIQAPNRRRGHDISHGISAIPRTND